MFAIYRQAKIKSATALAATIDHNGRHHAVENAVAEYFDQNRIEGPGRAEIVARWREMVGTQKIRKNAVWAVELFCGFSPEARGQVDPAKWFAEAKKFAAAEFGEANILHCALHMDEKTPHAHIVVVPKRPTDGKLDASYFSDGRRALSQRQTRFAQEVGAQFGLRRGEEGSEAIHEPPAKWRAAVEKEAAGVEVAPPPMVVGRAKYAEDVEKRLKDEVRRRTAAEKEAKRAKDERDRAREAAKELASKVRQMDLLEVMRACGYEGVRQGREVVFRVESGHVSINPEKQKYSCDWVDGAGGGGAIDLAMQVRGLKYPEAVAWLADLDPAAAAASARAHQISTVPARPKPLGAARRHEIQTRKNSVRWLQARRYLIDDRGIPAEVVDAAHRGGYVHANDLGALVFPHTLAGSGAEIRGTKSDFKGFSGKKSGWVLPAADRSQPAAVVESGIDGLSLRALGHGGEIVSTAGAALGPDATAHLRLNHHRVVIGYDADAAGDAAYERAASTWPELRRLRPPGGGAKDWNALLTLSTLAIAGVKKITKKALDTLERWKNERNAKRKRRARAASAGVAISGM